MLSFLAPVALTGLALLAIPIVVHLFKPRRVRVVPFSSLRWLRASQHRLSRRIQWHQIALFLLRAGLLALLVLAAARPVWRTRGDKTLRDRFVIVDAGRIMSGSADAHVAPMERARYQAEQLLSESTGGDQATVLVVGATPRALGPLSDKPSDYTTALRSLQAEGTELPVTSALRLIPLLRRNADRETEEIELIFLTPNLTAGWNQADIAAFLRETKVPVKVRVINTGADLIDNAWIAAAELRQYGDHPPQRRIRVQLGAVGERNRSRVLRLGGVDGMPDARREVVLVPGATQWLEFDVPSAIPIDRQVALLTLEPADALPDDDRFWLPLKPRGQQTLLVVEPESTQISELRPAYHLRMALDTLAEMTPGRFTISGKTPRELSENDLRSADLIFLVEPPPLTSELVATLRERVAAGAGLVVFLGPMTDVDFVNKNLYNPLQPDEGLLTRQLGDAISLRAGRKLARLVGLRWDHPILNPFADPSYGDLATAEFNGYFRLSTPAAGKEQVLAQFPDNTPALIESVLGTGKVFLINSTANDTWSDLTRRRGFLPLLDSLVAYQIGGGGSGQHRVGEPLRLALPPAAREASVRLFGPRQQPLRFERQVLGGRELLLAPTLTAPGIYRLEYDALGGETIAEPFVVQSGRAFSSLRSMDLEVLTQWWLPAEFAATVSEVDQPPRYAAIRRGLVEPLLIILALLVLLVETIYSCVLCPRANPRIVSDSVVSRRGFFQHHNTAGPDTSAYEEEL